MLGVFKLNKNASEDATGTSARFIMRAHQTFRVLLNAPVLKSMTVGDAKGNEPEKKSFWFGAIEEGRIVPHFVKVFLCMIVSTHSGLTRP